MAWETKRVVVAGLWLLSACGGDDAGTDPLAMMPPSQGSPAQMGGASSDASAGGALPSSAGGTASPATSVNGSDAGAAQPNASKPDAGASGPGGASAGGGSDGGQGGAPRAYDYAMQEVALMADLVIPAGKTVRVGPGVKFSAKSASTKVLVQGTLLVEGTQAAPSAFVGTGASESWLGIVVESGGTLMLDHASVSGAKYGLHAMPGSSYSVDHARFDTSFKGAVLQSNGTIAHSVFKAELLFPALTEDVSIDDPNGFLTIIEASPTVSNCRFEGSGGLNDMVRIGGNASPSFDHCAVNNSHCGFHISGAVNNSPRITNTVFESLSYGFMAYSSKPIVENSVFRSNGSDFGFCSGATAANAPQPMSNFYEGGAVRLDASCDKIGTRDPSVAASANASAGPSGI